MTAQFSVQYPHVFQRARGAVSMTAVRDSAKVSRLKNLRQEGSYRAVFPRSSGESLEAVIVNTAGGVTGGDVFGIDIVAQDQAHVSITTQAAERIYCAPCEKAGQISTTLHVQDGGQIFWLPQETILFEGSRLRRKLNVEVATSGTFLMVEPLVFGRQASGEDLRACFVHDSVSITTAGTPIYRDCIKMNGDIARTLQRSAVADGARAMASIVLVCPTAQQSLTAVRDMLPQTGGASLLAENILIIRLLAGDSFALRQTLLPILQHLTHDAVPKNWRL